MAGELKAENILNKVSYCDTAKHRFDAKCDSDANSQGWAFNTKMPAPGQSPGSKMLFLAMLCSAEDAKHNMYDVGQGGGCVGVLFKFKDTLASC